MKKMNGLKAFLLTVCGATAIAATGCDSFIGYTVTFEENGGTEYEILTTDTEGQSIQLPTPERFGYAFEGWFLDEALETPVDGNTYVPTKDVTFYAKWRAIEFTVAFVSNGGTEYEEVTAVAQSVTLPVPEKEHHEFLGWYLTEDFSGDAVSGEFFSEDGSVTLYAKWEAEEGRVISFDTKGGGAQANMEDYGDGITLPVPTDRYGYVFTGWYEEEGCSGTPLEGKYYAEEDSVVLFAGWKEVVYLYVYYGDSNEYDRLNYDPGTVLNVEDLETPQDITVNGVLCSFDYWADETFSPITSVTLDAHTDIFAIFDEKDAPVKDTFIPNSDGSFTSSYRAGIKVFIDEEKQSGGYSIDITFPKGASGGVNATFRMKLSGQDYPYDEAGTEYLSAGLFPATGKMQIYRVKDGALANFVSSIALVDLPQAWQDKFNTALNGELITMSFTVYDYGDGFEIYVDGEKIYTCTDTTVLSQFTGTGFGVRSSTPSAKFANARFAEFKAVTLQANGGINVAEQIYYAFGKLTAEIPLKENAVFDGWYYDEQLTQKVDVNAPNITENTTLYAGYRTATDNVTLYDEGTIIATYGYAGGMLYLPKMSNRANRIFTGWYYDDAYTQPVDEAQPSVEGNTLIYAGWRYPKHESFERNEDGSYTIATGKSNGAFVVGESTYRYTEYKLEYSIEKGVTTGAASLAFRMNMYEDNVVDGRSVYMTFGLNTASTNGKVEVGYSNGSNRYVSIAAIQLASTPLWNETFTAGGTIDVQLCVRDYGDCIQFFINGELAYTLKDAETLAKFDGIGYGIRSSAKNITYTMSMAEIPSYELTLIDGSEEETVEYIAGYTQLPQLSKADYIFLGWFTNEECTQGVGEITQSTTLYAAWKRAPYMVSLVTNCENALDAIAYETGAITLPTPTTAVANRIFTGWYYNEECTQQVDVENPTISGDTTLYAGWRYPNKAFTISDGTYSVGTTDGVVVAGESNFEYVEYSITFDVTLGTTTGAASLCFRMKLFNENNVDYTGNEYLTFGLNTAQNNGSTVIGYSNPSTGRFVTLKTIAKKDMPQAWQTLYAQTAGTVVSITLSVRDYGTYIEAYANDDLVCTYEDTATNTQLSTCDGIGYGIRSSADNMSYTIAIKEIEKVTEETA